MGPARKTVIDQLTEMKSVEPFRKSILPYIPEIGIDDGTFEREYRRLSKNMRTNVLAEIKATWPEVEEAVWRKYWKDHMDNIKMVRGYTQIQRTHTHQ